MPLKIKRKRIKTRFLARKRYRRTNAECANDVFVVWHMLRQYGVMLKLTNRQISAMTRLATHRVQGIIGRLNQ